MFEIVKTSKDFLFRDKSLPQFPMIMNSQPSDSESCVFEVANEWLICKSFEDHRDIACIRDLAMMLVEFLNFIPVFVDGVKQLRDYRLTTERHIIAFQQGLIKGSRVNSPARRNRYISAIYDFFYFAEEKGFINGVIGFNDSSSTSQHYSIPLSRAKSSEFDYSIDFLESTSSNNFRPIDSPERWLEAVNTTKFKRTDRNVTKVGKAIAIRNELMLRCAFEGGLRREEFKLLQVTDFQHETEKREVYIRLIRSKNSLKSGKGRLVLLTATLFNDIVRFCKRQRKLLSKPDINASEVFLSKKTGKALTLTSISHVFRGQYDVRPHDGRKISLTEQFVSLITSNHSEATAIEIVSQRAGHSRKSNGETLKQHYLQAEAMVRNSSYSRSCSTNEEELDLLRRQVEELKEENSLLKAKIFISNFEG